MKTNEVTRRIFEREEFIKNFFKTKKKHKKINGRRIFLEPEK